VNKINNESLNNNVSENIIKVFNIIKATLGCLRVSTGSFATAYSTSIIKSRLIIKVK
jgi:hypothetical protein